MYSHEVNWGFYIVNLFSFPRFQYFAHMIFSLECQYVLEVKCNIVHIETSLPIIVNQSAMTFIGLLSDKPSPS